MVRVNEILARINEGSLIEVIFNKEVDWDAELDARDADDFAEAWHACYDEVNVIGMPEDPVITDIRESVFKQTFRITHNPDLAGYVSDDFGLIAIAFEHKIQHVFINDLWNSYIEGYFPRNIR